MSRFRVLASVCVALLAPAAAVSIATPAAVPSGSTPYIGIPAPIPGTVFAENFDDGGQGVAYFDTTPGNSGGAYRSTDVDIQPSSLGGLCLYGCFN